MVETSQLKEPAGDAAERRHASHYLMGESIALGLVYCVVFALVGKATPAFLDVYRGSMLQDWRLSLLTFVHLGLTLPLALIISTLLIWKDRCLVPTAVGRLNIAAFAILVLFGLFWFYAMVWIPFPHLTSLDRPA